METESKYENDSWNGEGRALSYGRSRMLRAISNCYWTGISVSWQRLDLFVQALWAINQR